MIVKVIPLRRMPLKMSLLDYAVPNDLKNKIQIGSLVSISLRKQISYGVVAEFGATQTSKKISVKQIIGIFLNEPFISQQIIDFISEFSLFYHVSPGFVLKNSFFNFTKKNLLLAIDNLKISPDKIKAQIIQKPILFNYKTSEEKYKKIIKICDITGQKLILAPTVEQANEIFQNLPQKIKKTSLVITSETTDKQYFENWLKIRNNKNIIVIGTRRAIFLPWHNLKAIIMDDEGNPLHKSWDMTPRFHSRDAILMLSKFTKCHIYFFSHTPSIESYFFAKKNIYALDNSIETLKNPSPIFLERTKKNSDAKNQIIDDDIIESIVSAKKNTFIYINKKLSYTSIICKDCGNLFTCANCGRSLNYSKKNNLLICEFCNVKKELPLYCPKCNSADYVFLGAGIESIATEIGKKIPQKNIVVIDKDSSDVKNKLFNIKNKIVIGTDYAWSRIDWGEIEVFAIIDPDFYLILPEYKATEDLWQKIRQAQFLLPADSNFYIQTANIEHHLFKGIYRPEYFYAKELMERKKFGYPPFKFLIRLLIGLNNENESFLESKNFYNKLKNLTNGSDDVTISSPLKANPPYYRSKYWHIILVKADYAKYKKITANIAKNTDQIWKFDPNPNNILSIS